MQRPGGSPTPVRLRRIWQLAPRSGPPLALATGSSSQASPVGALGDADQHTQNRETGSPAASLMASKSVKGTDQPKLHRAAVSAAVRSLRPTPENWCFHLVTVTAVTRTGGALLVHRPSRWPIRPTPTASSPRRPSASVATEPGPQPFSHGRGHTKKRLISSCSTCTVGHQ